MLIPVQRKATANWQGGLRDGRGTISTGSAVLSQAQYGFSTRFEQGPGTNPEELVAAAHAGCFAMALSAQLENAGIKPQNVEVTCTVTFEKREGGWEVTESHLDVTARIPGADRAKFEQAANSAKSGCPISKLLKTNITMTANLAAQA